MRVILALVLVLLATLAACTPSSTPGPPTAAPGAPGRSLPVPLSSRRGSPTPTIEVPPPID